MDGGYFVVFPVFSAFVKIWCKECEELSVVCSCAWDFCEDEGVAVVPYR